MSDDLSTMSPVESVPTRFHGIGWAPPNWDNDGNELELHRSCEVYSVEGESCLFVLL